MKRSKCFNITPTSSVLAGWVLKISKKNKKCTEFSLKNITIKMYPNKVISLLVNITTKTGISDKMRRLDYLCVCLYDKYRSNRFMDWLFTTSLMVVLRYFNDMYYCHGGTWTPPGTRLQSVFCERWVFNCNSKTVY